MADFAIQSSAGMLYPEPKRLPLAGRRFWVDEFQVRQVGAIEVVVAMVVGHPHAGLEHHIEVINNRSKYEIEEVREAGIVLSNVGRNWPPTFGSTTFSAFLATPEGERALLWVALCRDERNEVSVADIPGLIEGAEPGEIPAIFETCWGYADWEAGRSARANVEEDDGPRPGYRWGEWIDGLCVARKWTYEDVGKMYLSQFSNALRNGADRIGGLKSLSPPDPEIEESPDADA
jgi:hypothetical protein